MLGVLVVMAAVYDKETALQEQDLLCKYPLHAGACGQILFAWQSTHILYRAKPGSIAALLLSSARDLYHSGIQLDYERFP
ncbi:hypothetical protein [Massilia sp. SYSU DXS3249]